MAGFEEEFEKIYIRYFTTNPKVREQLAFIPAENVNQLGNGSFIGCHFPYSTHIIQNE